MGDLDRPSPPAPAFDRLFLDFQSALVGRYSLERELGRGGMGVVYLAREVRLDRLVAIKLLPPARASDAKRSEEHTSELQSPMYLVCRLLLEKKNKNQEKREHTHLSIRDEC